MTTKHTPDSFNQFGSTFLPGHLGIRITEVSPGKVAAEMKVPLVDLNARSAAIVDRMGARDATQLAQLPPSAEELAAAEAGTTLDPRPAPAGDPNPPADSRLPRGTVTRKFDYTHVGDVGAELFARLVTRDLAVAIPELRSQLVS